MADGDATLVAILGLIGVIVASTITAAGTVVVALIQARSRDRARERAERENRLLKRLLEGHGVTIDDEYLEDPP